MPTTLLLWLILLSVLLWRNFTRHPVWGLGAYLFVLYAAPTHHWYGSYLPNLRWSLLTALLTLVSIWVNKARMPVRMPWNSNGAAKILMAYTIWLWIQLPWALSFDIHLDACILFTKYIILFYMIYTIVDTDIRFYQFIMFNILGGLYWGYLIKGFSTAGRVERLGGPGIYDSNTLGMHLGVILVFASLMLLKKNTLFRNTLLWWSAQGAVLIAAVLMANGVVQTVSRSAVVGLVAGGLVLFLLNHKAFRKKFIIYAMAAMAGFMYFTPDKFWGRINTVTTAVQVEAEEIEASAYSRIVIAKAQLKMFKTNILGYGHRGTVALSPQYLPHEYLTIVPGQSGSQYGRSSHNTFLTTLVEQGFPGAVLYWTMVFWVIKTILSFKKDDVVVYLYVMMMAAGLTTVFIAGVFVDFLKAEVQIFCLAMLASLKEYARIKKEQTPCAE